MTPRPRLTARLSPETGRLLQLALTLLVALYMLLAGGTFDATVRYPVKLFNWWAAAVLGGLWLLARWRARRPLAATGLEWPLAAFALSQWVAVATSLRPRLSLEWAAALLAWLALFWLLHDLFAGGWPRRYGVQALLLMAVILAGHGLLAAWQWYAGWLALGQLPPVNFRYVGLLEHPNLTAGILNLLLPVVLAQLMLAPRRLAKIALGALAAAVLFTIFLTSSRAGWIATGVALVTLGALVTLRGDLRRHWPAWRGRWAALGRMGQIGGVVGALVVVSLGAWLLARQSQHITHSSLFESRRGFWGPAWQLFLMQPLTGAGPELFPWFYSATTTVPPATVAPHAHSLIFQILGGSGLIGLAALLWLAVAAALRLWRQWLAGARSPLTAGLLAGLAAFAVQHLFDYLLGTPIMWFVIIVVVALALAPEVPEPAPAPARRLPTWLPAGVTFASLVVFGFTLRAEALHTAGLDLAARADWPAAAALFTQAAQADPGFTLYAQSAAYADTQAGLVEQAIPLWQQSIVADPYWAPLPATLALLTHATATMQAARDLAPGSDLLALNVGALAEAQGDAETAQSAYHAVLNIRPANALALYWQVTPLRQQVLADWLAAQPPGASALTEGEAALARGDAAAAIDWFQRAANANPADVYPYAGLARAYWAAGDQAEARRYLTIGQQLPVNVVADSLPLRLLAGEFAAAQGDRAAAQAAWEDVFSAVNDYTLMGPGTYGYPQRSWFVYHRAALPSDRLPQMITADITAALDADFATLGDWYAAGGAPGLACLVWGRVYREAPDSLSGARWAAACADQS